MKCFLWVLVLAGMLDANGMGKKSNGYAIADHSNKANVTFLVFGDFGKGTDEQKALGAAMYSACQARSCDMAVTTGDNLYPAGVFFSGDSKFDKLFEVPYSIFGRFDFWMVLGNHDHRGNGNAQVEYTRVSSRWRMPGHDYAIPQLPGWLHIYALDTYPIENRGWQYGDWKKQLARARAHLCGRPGWRLLVGHHPVYSAGRGPNPKIQETILPLIRDCGVQVYLAGHDHHAEHSTLANPHYEQVIQGSAGEVRTVDVSGPLAQNDAARTVKYVGNHMGFAIAQASAAGIKFDYYDASGAIRHSFAVGTPPAPAAAPVPRKAAVPRGR